MNQHFNKLTVEAAIRVAIVNPNEYIYINGKRSKNRLAVRYFKNTGNLVIVNVISEFFNAYEELMSFDISAPMKKQRSITKWLSNMAELFCDWYREDYAA